MENRYLTKHGKKCAFIDKAPVSDLGIVVVIPCYDEPGFITCLESLLSATVPECMSVEIFILINYPQSASKEVEQGSQLLQNKLVEYAEARTRDRGISIFSHLEVFTDREAGVGLARKIAMDEAVRRFEYLRKDGIIVNLDADCKVEKNYFEAIRLFYEDHPEVWAGSVFLSICLMKKYLNCKRTRLSITNYTCDIL
ncbi:MAG: glycosyltransferase family 2 protein [Saprospiraceae bacterium]|nr:glycosyltransferase family 2 protein [Saprospiraceae bacterium]